MRTDSLVSIIVSDLETHPSLPRMLQSVARQSTGLDATEILIVGNGAHAQSDVETWAAIAGSDNLSLITLDADTSMGDARNAGAAKASGDFLVFLRPDYRLDPKYLTTAQSVFMDYPEADVMYADYIRIGGGKRVDMRSGLVQLPNFDVGLLQSRNFLGPAVMLRTSSWERTQGFRDNTAYREWDLWVQAASTGSTFFRVDYPLATSEQRKVSFKDRADDGRCKAMLVINNPAFFPPHTVRWAVAHLRGETWAQSFGFMTVPGPMDVARMQHDHNTRIMGTDALAREAIRQFDTSPHAVEAAR